jgi:arabinofuranosyltransferase
MAETPATEEPSRRRGRGLLYGAAALWCAVAALLATRLRGAALDDFFITYRYAFHLANGRGFVFNLGERVFGLTNPGLAILLAALARLGGGDIPVLATIVFAGALVALAWVLARSASRCGHLAEALGGGTLVVTSSYLWAQQGGESIPMLALLAGAAEIGRVRPLLAGGLAGVAVWFRPEAGLGVGFLFLLLWLEERRAAVRFAAVAAAVVGAGLLAAAWYFGTPIPNSLAAKQAMAAGLAEAWTGWRFWLRSVRLVARHGGPLWPLLAVLGLAGQVPLFASGSRPAKVLVLFASCLTILYPLSGVPWFPWYTIPTVVAALYGIAFLAGWVIRLLARPAGVRRRTAAALAGCILALPVAFSLAPASYHWFQVFHWPAYMDRYRRAGLWLARTSPPQASVGYYEVGALGYFSDRTIVDVLGIVTPELLPFVRRGDIAGAFLARAADYAIFDTARGGFMPVATPWFRAGYRPVARFGDLTVFERRWGVALPPPPAAGH